MMLFIRICRGLFNLLVALFEGVLWIGFFLCQLLVKTSDLVRGLRSFKDGVLICPRGHEVPTEGGTYACQSCGYAYGGDGISIWQCPNPECRAVTPYVYCPTCGLSVRNPYRWGRP